MATKTITQLTAKAVPEVADEAPIWDTAGADTNKATIANLLALRLGTVFDVSNYSGADNAKFASALSDATASGGLVFVGEDLTISGAHTIEKDTGVIFSPGSVLSAASTQTITVTGAIYAGRHQFVGTNITLAAQSRSLTDTVYPEWWGENTTPGTTDMTAEIQAAIDFVEARTFGGTVELGAEHYFVSSTITINHDYIVIKGHGKWTTNIRRTGDYGDTFEVADSVPASNNIFYNQFRGLAIKQQTNRMTSGAHIKAIGMRRFVISDCLIENGYNGLRFIAQCGPGLVQDVLIYHGDPYDDVNRANSCIYIDEDSSYVTQWGSLIRITDCEMRGVNSPQEDSVTYGVLVTGVDGFHLTDSHIANCQNSQVSIQPANNSWCALIEIRDNLFDASADGWGIRLSGTTTSTFGYIMIHDNMMLGGGGSGRGIALSGATGYCEDIQIHGNMIKNYGSHGIIIGQYNVGVSIKDNTVSRCNMDNSAGINSITVGNNTKHFWVNDNKAGHYFDGDGTPATALTKYGLVIGTGCDEYTVIGNDFRGNTTGAISDGSSGANSVTADNLT